MRKLRLDPGALAVESFDVPHDRSLRATVHGRVAIARGTFDTQCETYTADVCPCTPQCPPSATCGPQNPCTYPECPQPF